MNPSPVGAVGPGLVGFLVVAAIGLALFFLVRSMNKRLSKIEVPREREQGREIPIRDDSN